MTDEPWFLPVGCYSIIVKHEAVVRSFDGSDEEFERVYKPIRKNAAHYLLIAFSPEEVEKVLGRLQWAGIEPGEDVAVADKVRKPVLECSGVAFRNDGGPTNDQCRVHVAGEVEIPEPSQPIPPLLDTVDANGPIPIDTCGIILPSLQDPEAGLVIAWREGFGAVDCWDEYLCAFRGYWGFILDVYRYQWLGEVPDDWYDDDGDLLPEHKDTDGDLRLPEEIDLCPVLGWRYGGFIGPFDPIYGGPGVQISHGSEEMVRIALHVLHWREECVADVQGALQMLAEAAENRQHPKPVCDELPSDQEPSGPQGAVCGLPGSFALGNFWGS